MDTTKTVNSLAEDVLGTRINKSCDNVQLDRIVNGRQGSDSAQVSDAPVLSVDEFGKRHLDSKVARALSRASENELGLTVEVERIHITIQGRGLALLLIVVGILILLIGVNQLLDIIQAVH
jgi:hypothetical protein